MANEGLLRDSRLPKINVSKSQWFRARMLGPRGVDPIHTVDERNPANQLYNSWIIPLFTRFIISNPVGVVCWDF